MNKAWLECLLIAVAGAAFAIAANALSPRGLTLSRNYFPAAAPALAGSNDNSTGASASLESRLRAEGLQLAQSNQVWQLFRDPRREQDLILFIDARNDEHYQEGHIPGAYQFDHFYPENYLAAILPLFQPAQQIVVYCNGGDCDDSQNTAIMLRDSAGVPGEKLFVYAGGMTEWATNNLPVELGARNSGKFRNSR